MATFPMLTYKYQCNLYSNSRKIFAEIDKLILIFLSKWEEPRIVNTFSFVIGAVKLPDSKVYNKSGESVWYLTKEKTCRNRKSKNKSLSLSHMFSFIPYQPTYTSAGTKYICNSYFGEYSDGFVLFL